MNPSSFKGAISIMPFFALVAHICVNELSRGGHAEGVYVCIYKIDNCLNALIRVSSGLKYRLCQRMVQGKKVQCLTSASMISCLMSSTFSFLRDLTTQSTKRHYFSYFLIMPTHTSGSTGKPVCSMYELKKILPRRSIQYTCTRTINVKFANMMLSYNGWHT